MNITRLLMVIFVAIFIGVVIFEAIKTYLFPDLGYWQSELVTIGFSTSAAMIIGYFTLKKFEKIILLQRETANNLLKAKKEADDANKNKTEFLSSMSHELRTPLNAIIGFSDMMQNKVLGEIGNQSYEEYVKNINQSGHHLLDLINDILDLSKIEAGKLEIFIEKIYVAQLVESCANLVKGRASEAGVYFNVNLEHAPDFFNGDNRKLKQVLINLLTNAIKFTPAEGTVTLRVDSTVDGWIRFAVSDTGVGVSEQDIPKIMEPFKQADNPLFRNHEGTGLGLPLSKELVELHGGTFDFKSEPGRGSCVTVTIPAR